MILNCLECGQPFHTVPALITWLTLIAPQGISVSESILRVVVGGLGGLAVAAVAIFIWNLFRAPYRQRDEALADLESTKNELDDLKTPKLSIVFGEDGSFEQMGPPIMLQGERLGDRRLFRIRVDNLTTNVIDDIEVQITEIKGAKMSLPIHLHLMHDNASGTVPPQHKFALSPRQIQYVDVVMKHESDEGHRVQYADQVILACAEEGVSGMLPAVMRYVIKIEAHAPKITNPPKKFGVIECDEHNHLHFTLQESPD